MGKLFVNSIEGLTTEKDFDVYFAPKNGQRANEVNIGRPGKRLKKELNIVQDMLSILVNRPIRAFDIDTVYQYGELVQVTDQAGDAEYVEFWQSQVDNNLAIHPHWDENQDGTYWKQYEPFGNYDKVSLAADYKNDVKHGYNMHNSGYFIVGERMGRNVSIDRDEIAARLWDSGTKEVYPSLLRMQGDGGMLSIHGNLWEVPSERHRVSVFTDDGRFILGNKETINTDTEPHPYDNCFKFECWGDALITQDSRFGGWVTFDKGFKKVPFITVQDGVDTTLSDRLIINPSTSNGNIEINALEPILDKGSTLYLQNNIEQTGDVIINSGANTVHITNEGRIGVKKVAPQYQVDVKGQIASNNGDLGAYHLINSDSMLTINTCVNRKFYINAYMGENPEHLHIQNAGGDTYFNCTDNVIHLTSTGRVGIGVENPTCALDVSGNSIIEGNVTSSSHNIVNSDKSMRIESRSNDYNFRIMTASNDGSNSTLYIQDNNYSDIVINGDDSACIAARRCIHITDDGDIGVGIKTPQYKLHVNGTSKFNDAMYVHHDAGSSGTAIETNGRIRAAYFDGTVSNAAEATYAHVAGVLGANPNADLAERYEADDIYEAGTILSIGGEKEVTLGDDTKPVAGIVSTEPAFKMNENENNNNDYNPFIALKGRVPCKVNGEVKKGQYIVADKDGKGKGVDLPTNTLLVVGVALSDSINGVVEVKV